MLTRNAEYGVLEVGEVEMLASLEAKRSEGCNILYKPEDILCWILN